MQLIRIILPTKIQIIQFICAPYKNIEDPPLANTPSNVSIIVININIIIYEKVKQFI